MGGLKKKKGQAGEAISYMTRNAAIKKLQVSPNQFKKLCILKGIFPRQPKNKLKGRNKIYYYSKDIRFLLHEPILQWLRERYTIKKKIKAALGRNEKDLAGKLRSTMPEMSLDHILKERYPTFVDAVRDMDDALCLLYLFANYTESKHLALKDINNCQRMIKEFEAYVIRTRCLKKTFVSIKGIYYQAEIFGQPVTWIVPHAFSLRRADDTVDMNVMCTFLKFYETFMAFVLFKLYNSLGLHYPPNLNYKKAEDSAVEQLLIEMDKAEGGSGLMLDEAGQKSKKADPSQKEMQKRIATLDNKQLLALDAPNSAEAPKEAQPEAAGNTTADLLNEEFEKEQERMQEKERAANLFRGKKFFLSREVPRASLEFVIRSFGGVVSWEGPNAPFAESDDDIAYHIVDRTAQKKTYLSRVYVQPQWVFDSANEKVLLPAGEYAQNATLPPHLSPFVDDEKQGYVPERRNTLEKLKRAMETGETYIPEEEGAAESEDETEEVEAENPAEARYAAELRAEMEGKSYEEAAEEAISSANKAKRKLEKIQKEEEAQNIKERQMMLSKKDRYRHINQQRKQRFHNEGNEQLEAKRRKIKQGNKDMDE